MRPPHPTHYSGLQQAMDGISRFTTDNHMTLNVDKCGTMQCSFGRDPPLQLDITFTGSRVSNLPSMTLLGVTIASSLSWEHHVESVISKANSRRYFLVVLRRAGVTSAHLVRFYITFIPLILEYAAPVRHPGLTQRQSHQLETVQSLALHSIYPALPYRLAQWLLTTGLPPLADRRRAAVSRLCDLSHRVAGPPSLVSTTQTGLSRPRTPTQWLPFHSKEHDALSE